MDLDWTEVVVFVTVMLISSIVLILLIGLHYVKKIVNFLLSPITSRTRK